MTDDRVARNVQALNEGIASGVETARELAGRAQAVAGSVRDAAIETGNEARDAAAKAYQQGSKAADYVSRSTAEQPLTALLIAGVIGYFAAFMIHGR